MYTIRKSEFLGFSQVFDFSQGLRKRPFCFVFLGCTFLFARVWSYLFWGGFCAGLMRPDAPWCAVVRLDAPEFALIRLDAP